MGFRRRGERSGVDYKVLHNSGFPGASEMWGWAKKGGSAVGGKNVGVFIVIFMFPRLLSFRGLEESIHM